MTYKTAVLTIAGLLIAGCLGGASAPVASQAPVTAVPVGRVEVLRAAAAHRCRRIGRHGRADTATSPTVAVSARPQSSAPSQIEVDGMRTAPGARESAGVTNVSRVSTGAPTGGNALGGTIVSGQTAGAIPTTIDRNREPVRVRSTAPRNPLGPGTAPPIIAPELRDTTGRTIRNRQEVQF